jgi:hypothetical protein
VTYCDHGNHPALTPGDLLTGSRFTGAFASNATPDSPHLLACPFLTAASIPLQSPAVFCSITTRSLQGRCHPVLKAFALMSI